MICNKYLLVESIAEKILTEFDPASYAEAYDFLYSAISNITKYLKFSHCNGLFVYQFEESSPKRTTYDVYVILHYLGNCPDNYQRYLLGIHYDKGTVVRGKKTLPYRLEFSPIPENAPIKESSITQTVMERIQNEAEWIFVTVNPTSFTLFTHVFNSIVEQIPNKQIGHHMKDFIQGFAFRK